MNAICLKAANIIEQKGWCQKQAIKADGSVCISKALVDASYPNGNYNEARDLVIDKLGIRDVMPLTMWNDKPERTKEEVIAVLRSC